MATKADLLRAIAMRADAAEEVFLDDREDAEEVSVDELADAIEESFEGDAEYSDREDEDEDDESEEEDESDEDDSEESDEDEVEAEYDDESESDEDDERTDADDDEFSTEYLVELLDEISDMEPGFIEAYVEVSGGLDALVSDRIDSLLQAHADAAELLPPAFDLRNALTPAAIYAEAVQHSMSEQAIEHLGLNLDSDDAADVEKVALAVRMMRSTRRDSIDGDRPSIGELFGERTDAAMPTTAKPKPRKRVGITLMEAK